MPQSSLTSFLAQRAIHSAILVITAVWADLCLLCFVEMMGLWLPLFSLLAQSFAGHDCYALSAKYRNAFKRQLEFIVAKN
ncbi:MAG: hypothetical protein M1511_16715, partial [Deltaproteobacteria bacterium]|nr:hypothetical protein [Deltaproteobacteria bacterium]